MKAIPAFFSYKYIFLSTRLSQKLIRKGWSLGSSRSSTCCACFLGKLCRTCQHTDRKGETACFLFPLISNLSSTDVKLTSCNLSWHIPFIFSSSLNSLLSFKWNFASAAVRANLLFKLKFVFILLCFRFLLFQLELWVELPPHSRLCEWRCKPAGPKTVPDDPSWTPNRAHVSYWRDRGSISTPHTH